MKINLGNDTSIEEISYGDVVVTKSGNRFLIIKDEDGDDFRALDLDRLRPTDYRSSISALFDYEVFEDITYVIKSENIELRKC